MKIPPLNSLGRFVVPNRVNSLNRMLPPSPPLSNDTVSFSASTAYYLKKYNTLPDEIKQILSPKDGIDMFKDMEMIQKGISEGRKIGQGNYSRVYKNPWLEDYYFLIVHDPKHVTQVVYSRYDLGDSVWADKDQSLQLIKKAG